MKRCPECYQAYQDTEIFCENDGRRLLNVPDVVVGETELVPDVRGNGSNSLATGAVGVFIGVLLCGGAYVAYSLLKPQADKEERTQATVESHAREVSPARPAPARSVEALPEPSESPTAEETQAEAAPEPAKVETTQARLNRGPVSTGEPSSARGDDVKVRTIIEMQDGSMVEVDAAWKDEQGVWYRRGGLVSFVDTQRVKAITARAEPKESPAEKK